MVTFNIRHLLAIVLVCLFGSQTWAQFKLPNPISMLKGENQGGKKPNNDSSSGITAIVLPEAMVRKELESRLDKLPSLDAWESMDDYDGPIATLMSILSPEGVVHVKQEYLKESMAKLKSKGTPKLSAESAINEFASNIAWELKTVAAKSPYRLTLVLGKIIAEDEAEQDLIDEVFTQLVENESITKDYVIISVPRDQADKVIEQVSGSTDNWKVPDGSNSNEVDRQVYHPDSVYVIDGTLRQWTQDQTQEFHSEFAARLYHPRTQTMIGGKEIRQDDVYYFHPTHQWINAAEDAQLARKAPAEQPELSLAFRAAVPVARQMMMNEIGAQNDDQAKAGLALILVNAGMRELAQREYKDRIGKMPAVVAWQDLEQPTSNASTLLAMLSPGGAAEARTRYARRARHAMRFQATPLLTTHEVIEGIADAVAVHMAEMYAKTGRRPMLVLGEVTADHPHTQRMLYDVYAKLSDNETLLKSCTIVGLMPDKARAMIDDLSGGVETWAIPDGSNLSEVGMTEVDTTDMYVVRGEFTQATVDDGRRFSSVIAASLTPAGSVTRVDAGLSFRQQATYYYHPIHKWIPEGKESVLQASYAPERDNGPLPKKLVAVTQNVTSAPAQKEPKQRNNLLDGLGSLLDR